MAVRKPRILLTRRLGADVVERLHSEFDVLLVDDRGANGAGEIKAYIVDIGQPHAGGRE